MATKAKLVTKDELKNLVGPGNATGIVWNGCDAEERKLMVKRIEREGGASAPNRENRRLQRKAKQKALTKKRMKKS